PVVLSNEQVDQLFIEVNQTPGYQLKVNLAEQILSTPSAEVLNFDVDSFRKHCLLNGLDDIGLTLEKVGKIRTYEERRQQETPWLFTESSDIF
ncbi:MAG: 3-isopropylmalate dehydratase small subunit, partial [Desulfuromusa sp.]|nr:3-isopropylmalate dehydratase small subunit [Desulfuromusa sp.]